MVDAVTLGLSKGASGVSGSRRRQCCATASPRRSAHWPLWRAAGGVRAGRTMRPR